MKALFNKYNILIITIIGVVLTLTLSYFIFIHQKDRWGQKMREEQFEKLDAYTEIYKNLRTERERQFNTATNTLQIFFHRLAPISLSPYLSETYPTATDSLTIPAAKVGKLAVNDKLAERITRTTGLFIEVWQKSPEGFVRIAHSLPRSLKFSLTTNFLNNYSPLIKEISEGNTVEKNDASLHFQSRSFPIYAGGKIHFFCRIIANELSMPEIYKNFHKKQTLFHIIDSKGNESLEKNNHLLSSKTKQSIFQKILEEDKDYNSFTIKSLHVYAKKISAYNVFVILMLPEANNSYSLSIAWLPSITAILFIVLLFSFVSYNRKKEKIQNTLDLESLIPLNNKELESSELSNSIKLYIEDLNNYVQKLKHGQVQEAEFRYKSEKKLNPLQENLEQIKQQMLIKKKEEDERIQAQLTKETLDRDASKITDILHHSSDLKELSYSILKNISGFLEIEQTGLFIVNETDYETPVMEMTAAYAYNNEKTANKQIPVKEGLVGRAYLEKEKIYLTELPQNYISMESGFGSTTPRCLLIVPLIFNNQVQAALECASVRPIEKYKIDFIETIGETIASTIANLKHTKKTQELLETTRIQSLAIEEQRQTLEEKINTHRRQNKVLDKEILRQEETINSIKSISYIVEYDLEGHVISLSSKLLELFDVSREETKELQHSSLILTENYEETYKDFWKNLSQAKHPEEIEETLALKGKSFTFRQSYTPVRNARRRVDKILSVGILINK